MSQQIVLINSALNWTFHCQIRGGFYFLIENERNKSNRQFKELFSAIHYSFKVFKYRFNCPEQETALKVHFDIYFLPWVKIQKIMCKMDFDKSVNLSEKKINCWNSFKNLWLQSIFLKILSKSVTMILMQYITLKEFVVNASIFFFFFFCRNVKYLFQWADRKVDSQFQFLCTNVFFSCKIKGVAENLGILRVLQKQLFMLNL